MTRSNKIIYNITNCRTMSTFYMISVLRKLERWATRCWNPIQACWILAAMRDLCSSGVLPSCHMDSCSRVTVVPWWHLQVHYQHVSYGQVTLYRSQSRMTRVVAWSYEMSWNVKCRKPLLKHAITGDPRSQSCTTRMVLWGHQKHLKRGVLLASQESLCKFRTLILLSAYCCVK
jgi:hypothetical protein